MSPPDTPPREPTSTPSPAGPLRVGVVMGSRTDWGVLRHASERLDRLGVAHEVRIVSAHRTPELTMSYAATAEQRGLQVIIAGAGGAAHLPGMLAARTWVPVLGVPVDVTALGGVDALLSIVQMPGGVPVGTFAIGKPGAINAAMFAAAILARDDLGLRERLLALRRAQADAVLAEPDPRTVPELRAPEVKP